MFYEKDEHPPPPAAWALRSGASAPRYLQLTTNNRSGRRQRAPLKLDGRPLRRRLGDRQGACRYTAHGVPHHTCVGGALKSNN